MVHDWSTIKLCGRHCASSRDAEEGSPLAKLLAEQGRVEELRACIEAGDRNTALLLADALVAQGRTEEADRVRRLGLSLDEN